MLKQKFFIGVALSSILALTGCVSEQSYVGSDKPVSDRSFDNIEAARTRISLGLNYLRRGDTSQAKYNLERARSFAPDSAEVHSALAYYYQSVGEDKQAEEYFRLAIQKDANYADAYNNYGAFLCQLQRYDEAGQLLLKAISRPGYIRVAQSYENLALCQLQQNNFSKAKTYLDSSVSHNTTRITALTMQAGISYAMGDNREAKNQLDRISRLGRGSARTVLLSYLIAEKSGDHDSMQQAEQLLLTRYTDTTETQLLLQGRLADSEFEQLRQRYKDSLMANIVLLEAGITQQEPARPANNPKLKIVKRKTPVPAEPVTLTSQQTAATSRSAPFHIVKEAESLYAISVQHNILLQRLMQWNQLTPASVIKTGQKIWLAEVNAEQRQAAQAVQSTARLADKPQTISSPYHQVVTGETMFAISYRYNIRLDRFLSWNDLTEQSKLKVGQHLYIVDPASIE